MISKNYQLTRVFVSSFYQSKLLGFLLLLFISAWCCTIKQVNATGFDTLPKKQFNVLVFSKTSGWHHKSILNGVKAIEELAEKHFFNVIWHQEAHYINTQYLADVDVVIFLATSGDILNEKQKQALETYVQSGKGFVGIHSAADTEYSWEWYQKLIGHTFIIHPTVQTALVNKTAIDFVGSEQLPASFWFTDEWYDFSEANTPSLQYLLTVDEQTYQTQSDWGVKQGDGMGDFHPIAWFQYYDGGRSFYTGLGHLGAVYQDPLFLAHLYGGIYWAATGLGYRQ
ncbi:ThuA domain-containing protein [Shewanella sp. MMG014]|uniref:ThuA domain-containing protein n=1 Tax=Shewanella sp. MMG014 TaxID=2822691 RepID=UPI001B374162|nr:ThuA domain-containing protein [Shewanella sp. MMG014]MBQ4891724.1 ThuA domain-containing protein [Shewanella sp. MMG014]